MSAIPLMATVLAERLGKDAEGCAQLLREVLAEVSRRRWSALNVDEKAQLHHKLESARPIDEEPFPASVAATIPLSMLPFFVRRIRDDLAVARRAWHDAYESYQNALRGTTLKYHEQKHLQITAAEKKATLDPAVAALGQESRRLKDRVESFERAEANLLHELEVRLELVRAGVLPDPDAVPMTLRHADGQWE